MEEFIPFHVLEKKDYKVWSLQRLKLEDRLKIDPLTPEKIVKCLREKEITIRFRNFHSGRHAGNSLPHPHKEQWWISINTFAHYYNWYNKQDNREEAEVTLIHELMHAIYCSYIGWSPRTERTIDDHAYEFCKKYPVFTRKLFNHYASQARLHKSF